MSAATVFGPGHPDQACDLVVAAVVEEYVRRDPEARLNIRACGGKGALFLVGEICSTADFDVSSVVKQALAACGVFGTIEPFISFEPMSVVWAKALGSRDPVTAQGYATNETPEFLPLATVFAQKIADALEEKRTNDQDWFWLGADYEVTVVRTADAAPLILIRAEHLDTQPLDQVRQRIQVLCYALFPGAEVRVNAAGEETKAGLAHRIGSSGRTVLGLDPRHPARRGAVRCQAIARRLVAAGRGKAVMVRATWLPLEARASFVRVCNEAGADLSAELQESDLDL